MTLDNILEIQRCEYEIFILNIILGIKMLQNDEQIVFSIIWQLLVE